MKKKVAIIGAGLAGLSCAHELERLGYSPVIYESKDYIGETHPHVAAVLEIATRPVRDCVEYLNNRLKLPIAPINEVKSIVQNGPHVSTTIKAQPGKNLGYFFERSRGPNDMKQQLYSSLKRTKVLFNHYGDYEVLSKKYDYVVVADGDTKCAKELGCWQERVNTMVYGAIVSGNFDPTELIVWINNDYCKNGYCYLTPYDSHKASIGLVVTDVNDKEIDYYWKLFWETERIDYNIIEEFKLEHHAGHVYPYQINNILLAGDTAGVISPFLGFGVMSALYMGVMAARSIDTGKDYNKLVEVITHKNKILMGFRYAFNASGNSGYDLLMALTGMPGLKHLIYYTPVNVVKTLAPIMRVLLMPWLR